MGLYPGSIRYLGHSTFKVPAQTAEYTKYAAWTDAHMTPAGLHFQEKKCPRGSGNRKSCGSDMSTKGNGNSEGSKSDRTGLACCLSLTGCGT